MSCPREIEFKVHPMSRELTGKRRFKRGSHIDGTPYLVLQVEVTEFITTNENKPGRWVCMWRDATPEDVTEEVV